MENNIEDLIREDFEKREIKPNKDAFDIIDKKVQSYRLKRRSKKVRIVAYAASIIGVVLMLQFMLKPQEKHDHKDVITNTIVNDSAKSQTPNAKSNFFIAIEEVDTTIPSKLVHKNEMKFLKEKFEKHTMTVVFNDTSQKMDSSFMKNIKAPKLYDSTHATAINTTGDTLKKIYKFKEITDAELDALLASAHQSLDKTAGDSLSIDAQKMLYELEVEINKPLPQRILFTVKTGVVTVKEIVKSNTKENK